MLIRRTKETDINRMMEIVRQAQEYLKSQGVDQWQDGYPNPEAFRADIAKAMSYVVEEEGEVVATFAFIIEEDPTYKQIYEGTWNGTEEYAVLHRVAVDNYKKGNGIGGKIVDYVVSECKKCNVNTIRIDTHRDNKSMQRMLLKNGFEQRGIIYLESGAERIAFEKIWKS